MPRRRRKRRNPPKLIRDMKELMRQEQGATLVPAAFLLFGLLDAVPIPTDMGYFYVQKWLDEHRDELTDRNFWFYQYLNYYGWDVAWYLALFAATYFGGKTIGQKAGIGLGVISLGAIGVELWKFAHPEVRHVYHTGGPTTRQSNPRLPRSVRPQAVLP